MKKQCFCKRFQKSSPSGFCSFVLYNNVRELPLNGIFYFQMRRSSNGFLRSTPAGNAVKRFGDGQRRRRMLLQGEYLRDLGLPFRHRNHAFWCLQMKTKLECCSMVLHFATITKRSNLHSTDRLQNASFRCLPKYKH